MQQQRRHQQVGGEQQQLEQLKQEQRHERQSHQEEQQRQEQRRWEQRQRKAEDAPRQAVYQRQRMQQRQLAETERQACLHLEAELHRHVDWAAAAVPPGQDDPMRWLQPQPPVELPLIPSSLTALAVAGKVPVHSLRAPPERPADDEGPPPGLTPWTGAPPAVRTCGTCRAVDGWTHADGACRCPSPQVGQGSDRGEMK